jgi:ApbE superfamily uncharacterized protein (UPF0280 family)
MIEKRIYREEMNTGRFKSFTVGYKDTDLWIGIDPDSYKKEMKGFAINKITELRKTLEEYIYKDPEFAKSLIPRKVQPNAPEIAKIMTKASIMPGIGPLSAVAGTFAECLGKEFIKHYAPKEVVIENGGDIFLSLQNELILSVYAGSSPLSGKVGIKLPILKTPIGVCTSAGKVGPSLSFGKADAVMVVCHSTPLADSWATSLGNRIKSVKDIEPVLKETEKYPEILSVLAICEGSIGIRGKYELQIL